jgi:hypothetical protein
MEFNELEWHDAVIKKISIDRTPAENDSISFEMLWPNGEENTIVFVGLRHVNMDLNFGYVGKEFVSTADVIDNSEEIEALKSKWSKIGAVLEFKCYVIETSTTGGKIKIFAESFNIEK